MNDKSELRTLCIAGTSYETQLTKKFVNRKAYVAPDPNTIRCVIPGVIQKVHVRAGQKVGKGEPVCILEAMKMQNDIVSPFDTRVKAVHVEPGQMVTKGELLIELVPTQAE